MSRAVFFGTPGAAVPILRTLGEKADVVLVVTRPDRPKGRSGRPRPSAVKEVASELGLPVAQPERVGELTGRLGRLAPDVGVLAAYGEIVPEEVLDAPRAGILNVHFSLLPRWRGAAPVERAILSADQETGVTLMLMDRGLDTGPILARRKTPIHPEDTTGTLTTRLAEMGAEMIETELPRHLRGELEPVPQDEGRATHAPKVSPAEARLDPSLSADRLWRAVRAFNPRPGAWGEVEGERFKVWSARPGEGDDLPPGRIELRGERLSMGTGERILELVEVQAAGRRRTTGAAWARGRREEPARMR